jgi:tetratricopeptide (TPR) repeat protein
VRQDWEEGRILAALPAIARRLDPAAIGAAAPPAAGYFAIAAIPARYALERGAWADAARLELHPGPIPFADAVTWFARGLGAARLGDTTAARTAIAALQRIQEQLARAGEGYWAEQVEIQRRAGAAWLAFAAGRMDEALVEMRVAAEREDATEKNAITPGPLAPARELLGEMLLAAGQPAPALAAFEATLQHEPNRFRAIAGAASGATAAGDRGTARKYYAALLELCAQADRPGRAALVEAATVMGRLPTVPEKR